MTDEPMVERLEREPCENFPEGSKWSCLNADHSDAPWDVGEWCHPCVRADAIDALLSQLREQRERAEIAELGNEDNVLIPVPCTICIAARASLPPVADERTEP